MNVVALCQDRHVAFTTVIFDFYGTLAEHDGGGLSLATLLRERGYQLDPNLAREYWQDGLDGTTHDEASQSRDHYTAWQRSRLLSLLDRSAVPTDLATELCVMLERPAAQGSMTPYRDASGVLHELRSLGVQTAICSNWGWDLREAIAASNLPQHFDIVVSSAWIGARKPHPRIYEHTLRELAADPKSTLFVGDTWNCDIAGPLAHGMTPVYVRRATHEPDHTRLANPVDHVHIFDDLRPIVNLCSAE